MALISFTLGVILFGIRVSCRSVLLLGDSIDRNIVEEWCEFYGYVEDSTPIRRTNMTNMIRVEIQYLHFISMEVEQVVHILKVLIVNGIHM